MEKISEGCYIEKGEILCDKSLSSNVVVFSSRLPPASLLENKRWRFYRITIDQQLKLIGKDEWFVSTSSILTIDKALNKSRVEMLAYIDYLDNYNVAKILTTDFIEMKLAYNGINKENAGKLLKTKNSNSRVSTSSTLTFVGFVKDFVKTNIKTAFYMVASKKETNKIDLVALQKAVLEKGLHLNLSPDALIEFKEFIDENFLSCISAYKSPSNIEYNKKFKFDDGFIRKYGA